LCDSIVRERRTCCTNAEAAACTLAEKFESHETGFHQTKIMAFTMHSHSGQFCPGHAKDDLEEIVLQAISLKMQTIGLSEHMPRNNDKDLYPEEVGVSSCYQTQ
jgi:hypothetical protein